MEVVHDKTQLRLLCDQARTGGHTVGVVPTMGALHRGHTALMTRAHDEGATFRVATVFVNPLQFAEGEDLSAYPRTLKSDTEICKDEGIDVLYAPSAEDMYPTGFQTTVTVNEITKELEGKHRPEHFAGVTTVVTKLLCRVGPSIAVFGKKDYQQFRVLSRLAIDLDLPVRVIGHDTVRDDDGLALSSRNRYLSAEERKRALCLPRALEGAAIQWRQHSQRDASVLIELVRSALTGFDSVDYVCASNPYSLLPAEGVVDSLLISVAARMGSTRLIDNVELL